MMKMRLSNHMTRPNNAWGLRAQPGANFRKVLTFHVHVEAAANIVAT